MRVVLREYIESKESREELEELEGLIDESDRYNPEGMIGELNQRENGEYVFSTPSNPEEIVFDSGAAVQIPNSPYVRLTLETDEYIFEINPPILEVGHEQTQIILVEDFEKIEGRYNDAQEELIDADERSRNEFAYDDISLDYQSIKASVENGEMAVVEDVASYLQERMDNGNFDSLFVSGKGIISFEEIPCSDMTEILMNESSIGSYSHDDGVELDPEYESFEEAIEINSVGDSDVGGGGEYDRDEEDFEW